jgi:hypothetical protein
MILCPPKPRIIIPSLADAVRWMSHLCKDPTTKHLKKKASGTGAGHFSKGCCDGCPSSYTLVASGISLCGPCFTNTTVASRWKVTSGSPNGTWTLTRVGTGTNPCLWQVSTSIVVSNYTFSDTTCSSPFNSDNAVWTMSSTTSGTFQLVLQSGTARFFQAQFAVGDCLSSLSFTNELVCSTTGAGIGNGGTGGSASVS